MVFTNPDRHGYKMFFVIVSKHNYSSEAHRQVVILPNRSAGEERQRDMWIKDEMVHSFALPGVICRL